MRERATRGVDAAMSWLEQLPLVTKWLTVVLCLLHLVVIGSGSDVHELCFAAEPMVTRLQLYRVVSVLLHAGVLHLLMNVLALLSLGRSLEARLGSARLATMTASIAVLSMLLQLLGELALRLSGRPGECSVGFSGVLFGLYVVDLKSRSHEQFFGFLLLPSLLAPFVMLALAQVLFHASFVGHLAGIVAGHAVPYLPHFASVDSALEGWLAKLSCAVSSSAAEEAPQTGLALPFWTLFAPLVSPTASAPDPEPPRENLGENLRALMEMGFERTEALRALQESNGVLEEAVYILSVQDNV